MKKISICIPVYQNAESVDQLFLEIVNVFSTLNKYTFEVIFVNDGSTDKSLEHLKAIRANNSNVIVINFSKNYGQLAAIIAGWKESTGDAVINIGADLQDPPSQCLKMIEEWEKGNDIVISYRNSHATSSAKKMTSKIFYKLLFPEIPIGGFDFTLIDRKPLNYINEMKDRNRSYHYDILSIGFDVKFIPYEKTKRLYGKSQYNFKKRFKLFYTAFLNVSYLPIRIMISFGIFFSFSGFIYGLLIFKEYLYKNTPFVGWAPIMILLLLIGGIIMIMIGILGEYVWRILDEVKKRPTYLIKDKY